MPEPQKMIRLTPAQKKKKDFRHPMTDGAPVHMSDEELNKVLTIYFETGNEFDALILNYTRLLRSTISRYLFHWPVTRRFLDEMVSTGFEAIVRIITNLTPEKLAEQNLIRLIDSSIRIDIETMLNDLRGLTPASRRTNFYLERKHLKPIYGCVEASLEADFIQDLEKYDDSGLTLFEMQDAVNALTSNDLERSIFAEENWGLSNIEIAEKLKLTPQWVGQVRKQFYELYKNLGEKNE